MSVPSHPTHYVDVPGAQLAVYDCGPPSNKPDAPTVLFSHGFPDSHEVWVPVARRLAPHVRVILYDVRGAGVSTGGACGFSAAREFDAIQLARDARAVADALLPLRNGMGEPRGDGAKMHLVGHDWGSIHGWTAACAPWAGARWASYTSLSGPPIWHNRWWAREQLRTLGVARGLARVATTFSKLLYIFLLMTPVLGPLAISLLAPAAAKGICKHNRIPQALGYPTASTVRRDAVRATAMYRRNFFFDRLPWIKPVRWTAKELEEGQKCGAFELYARGAGPAGNGAENGTQQSPLLGATSSSEPPTIRAFTRTPLRTLVLQPTKDRYVTPALTEGIERWGPKIERLPIEGSHWVHLTNPDLVAQLVLQNVLNE